MDVDISHLYPSRVLDYHAQLGLDSGIPLGNMGLCRLPDGRYLACIRQFNYMIGTGKTRWLGGFLDKRANHIALLDRDFSYVSPIRCEGLELMEDLRLVRFGDELQVSCTDVSRGWKRLHMVSKRFRLDMGGG